jgi:hypothetical protein
MTLTELKYFTKDRLVTDQAQMASLVLCLWKSSKMRYHAPASWKSLIKFNNNAASCLGCIIPVRASLIGRKHGIH